MNDRLLVVSAMAAAGLFVVAGGAYATWTYVVAPMSHDVDMSLAGMGHGPMDHSGMDHSMNDSGMDHSMNASRPRTAYALDRTFSSAGAGPSLEDSFRVQAGYETLEIKLTYSGAGALRVVVFDANGSRFYEHETSVTPSATDGSAPVFVESAETGEYEIELRVTGHVDVKLEAVQHPHGHAPDHEMDHARPAEAGETS